jgi:hypothetical protein
VYNYFYTDTSGDYVTVSGQAALVVVNLIDTGDVAGDTVAADSKTTPVDADVLPMVDSQASNVLKKLSWSNIKATLKSYFDLFYNLFLTDHNVYGFTSLTDTQLTFDGTNTVTLSALNTSWSYYRTGIRHTVTGNKSCIITGTPLTTGKYYIYIDATDGALSYSNQGWTLYDTKVPVAVLYFNNSLTPKYILSNERHTCLISRRDHMKEHYTAGTVYSSGGALTGYTPNTATDAGNSFGIDAANIFDEDLYHTLSALTDNNGTVADYFIVYRSGANYIWALSKMPFIYSGASAPYGLIEYDAAGTITPVTQNRYVNYYLLMTNSIASNEAVQGTNTSPARFILVPGRAQFTNTNSAYAEQFSSFALTGFPVDEAVAVWQITFEASEADTVKGRCRINRVSRINSNIINSTTVSSAVHNGLTGLQGGESGEYYHLTEAQHTAVGNTSGTNTGDQIADGTTITGAGTVADPFKISPEALGNNIKAAAALYNFFKY